MDVSKETQHYKTWNRKLLEHKTLKNMRMKICSLLFHSLLGDLYMFRDVVFHISIWYSLALLSIVERASFQRRGKTSQQVRPILYDPL